MPEGESPYTNWAVWAVFWLTLWQAERDPEEEGDFMAFEQLMAEAAAKKENKHDKKEKHKHGHDKKEKEKEKA